MSRPALAGLLVLALLVSGCIGASSNAPGGSVETTKATGDAEGPALVIEVVDLSLAPLADADVTVAGDRVRMTATSDATGQATFWDLPPGELHVEAHAPGHLARALQVKLPGSGTVHETLTLPPLAADETYTETFEFQGFFECSATYLIVTGDCLTLVRAGAEQAGLEGENNATNERFTFPFVLHPGWTSLTLTQTWEEPVAGAGSMMRVNLEPLDANNTEGHGDRYARAEGTSPITLTVENDGEPAPTASQDELIVPEAGGLLRTRTFHLGLEETHDPAGTGFLGVGASFQQSFTVVIEVTYG
ncbi:MAG: carboxypeptidase-like regulatory domain-containing protein [Candidatus Thermoplasmatota archaeon]|nr:carboxypeptidase-like regulatory domain-containing protein [Candidatus Thermoplasmatota archaeon]